MVRGRPMASGRARCPQFAPSFSHFWEQRRSYGDGLTDSDGAGGGRVDGGVALARLDGDGLTLGVGLGDRCGGVENTGTWGRAGCRVQLGFGVALAAFVRDFVTAGAGPRCSTPDAGGIGSACASIQPAATEAMSAAPKPRQMGNARRKVRQQMSIIHVSPRAEPMSWANPIGG